MITENKIKIFKKYNGDIDEWVRNNSSKELSVMSDNDWFLIGEFLQDLMLVKSMVASLEFSNTLDDRLKEICDNDKTINQLKAIINSR